MVSLGLITEARDIDICQPQYSYNNLYSGKIINITRTLVPPENYFCIVLNGAHNVIFEGIIN